MSQSTGRVHRSERFKFLAYGKCSICLATDHQVHDCRSPTSCWRCRGRGHHARSVPGRLPMYYLKTKALAKQAPELHRQPSPPLSHQATHSSTRADGCSYLETTRGIPAPAAMEAYPSDPRARLAFETVYVYATGATKRWRDALMGKAAVCWLEGNSRNIHDSEPFHVRDALRSKLGMGRGDFQVVKHYSKQYLVVFSMSACDSVQPANNAWKMTTESSTSPQGANQGRTKRPSWIFGSTSTSRGSLRMHGEKRWRP